MMQQLLTTSRQLTLGAYKHETECKYQHYTARCEFWMNKNMFLKTAYFRSTTYYEIMLVMSISVICLYIKKPFGE